MRPAVLATTGISALVVTLLALKPHQLPALAGVAPKSPTASASPHTPAGASTGTGTFTGDPIDTQYGAVQVAAVLSKGKIISVKVLQAPDQNGRDQQIAAGKDVVRRTADRHDMDDAGRSSVAGGDRNRAH